MQEEPPGSPSLLACVSRLVCSWGLCHSPSQLREAFVPEGIRRCCPCICCLGCAGSARQGRASSSPGPRRWPERHPQVALPSRGRELPLGSAPEGCAPRAPRCDLVLLTGVRDGFQGHCPACPGHLQPRAAPGQLWVPLGTLLIYFCWKCAAQSTIGPSWACAD